MKGLVVDASISGAWLLPDENSGKAAEVLAAALNGEVMVSVPDLWSYEIVHLLIAANRRGRIDLDQVNDPGMVGAGNSLDLPFALEQLSMAINSGPLPDNKIDPPLNKVNWSISASVDSFLLPA